MKEWLVFSGSGWDVKYEKYKLDEDKSYYLRDNTGMGFSVETVEQYKNRFELFDTEDQADYYIKTMKYGKEPSIEDSDFVCPRCGRRHYGADNIVNDYGEAIYNYKYTKVCFCGYKMTIKQNIIINYEVE